MTSFTSLAFLLGLILTCGCAPVHQTRVSALGTEASALGAKASAPGPNSSAPSTNQSYPINKDRAQGPGFLKRVLAASVDGKERLRQGFAESGTPANLIIVLSLIIFVVLFIGVAVIVEVVSREREHRAQRRRPHSERVAPPEGAGKTKAWPSRGQERLPEGSRASMGAPHNVAGVPLPSLPQTRISVGSALLPSANTPDRRRSILVEPVTVTSALSLRANSTTNSETVRSSADRRPMPLCPKLVLPHTEAQFVISFEQVLKPTEDMIVYGLSGNPLLRASAETNSKGMSLSMSMYPEDSPTLGQVLTAHEGHGDIMTIMDANGEVYARLQHTGAAFHLFMSEDMPYLAVFLDTSGQLRFDSTTESANLARAFRCMGLDQYSEVEHLEVRVNPGVDSILILCCTLAIVLFSHRLVLPVAPRPAQKYLGFRGAGTAQGL